MSRSVARSSRVSVWGPTAVRIRQSRVLRDPAVKAYRLAARAVLSGPPPKILANSVPKAGTHLLSQVLGGMPKLHYSGMHLIDKNFRPDLAEPGDGLGEFDATAFSGRLRTVRNGQYVTSHMGLLPGMSEVLAKRGFRSILIIRDPRDIAVSVAFYLAKNDRLNTYERFAKMSSFDERLMAVITGLPGGDGTPPVPSLEQRLTKHIPWLSDSSACVIRFEDLVGSGGGGSDEAQRECIRQVIHQCRRDAGEDLVTSLAESTFARHSATFRRGAIGDWVNHFTDEHLAALDEVAPGAVEAFGYSREPRI